MQVQVCQPNKPSLPLPMHVNPQLSQEQSNTMHAHTMDWESPENAALFCAVAERHACTVHTLAHKLLVCLFIVLLLLVVVIRPRHVVTGTLALLVRPARLLSLLILLVIVLPVVIVILLGLLLILLWVVI